MKPRRRPPLEKKMKRLCPAQAPELPGRRDGREAPVVEGVKPENWDDGKEPIAPEVQKPPKKRGRKPQPKDDVQPSSKEAKSTGKGCKRAAEENESNNTRKAPKTETKAKEDEEPKAPKAKAKGKKAKKEDEEELKEAAPKAKATAKKEEEETKEDAVKALRSRKSVAYVRAKKAALKEGCSLEEASAKGKEVICHG